MNRNMILNFDVTTVVVWFVRKSAPFINIHPTRALSVPKILASLNKNKSSYENLFAVKFRLNEFLVRFQMFVIQPKISQVFLDSKKCRT